MNDWGAEIVAAVREIPPRKKKLSLKKVVAYYCISKLWACNRNLLT